MKLNNPWDNLHRSLKPALKAGKDSQTETPRKQSISLKHLAVSLLPLGFLLMPLASPANAAKNEYDECAKSLFSVNISPQEVATSCSETLYPKDLASCVVDIASDTDILADDALSNCKEVRRPLELATCVVDISDVGTASDASEILDHCRRSLLPVNLSKCVLGLVNQTDLGIAESLRYCIDGSDRGRNLDLTWLPTELNGSISYWQ